jgi:hypothetical protein
MAAIPLWKKQKHAETARMPPAGFFIVYFSGIRMWGRHSPKKQNTLRDPSALV